MTTADPGAVLLAESAHQAAVVRLAMPVQAGFDLVPGIQLPQARQAQAVAVVVLALAGIGKQFPTAVFHRADQGQGRVALVADSRRDDIAALVVTVLHLKVGVPVVTQVMGDFQARRVERNAAEVLLLIGQQRALRGAFVNFNGLAAQLLIHRFRLVFAQRGQTGFQGFVAAPQTAEGLGTLRRVQVAAGEQGFDLGLVAAAQGFLDLFIAIDLDALGASPSQPFVFLRFLIGRIQTRQQAFEPQLLHRRRTVLPLQQFLLRLARRVAAGHQSQPSGVALARRRKVLRFRAAQQFQAQTLGGIFITGAVQRVGVGSLYQPVLLVVLEVHPVPGQGFAITAEHLAGAGEGQPQRLVTARIAFPLGQQRLEFRGVALVHIEPHQALTEQVVIGVQRQALQVQTLGFVGLALLLGQRATYRQHLRLLVKGRVILDAFEQFRDQVPIFQFLGEQQRIHQAQGVVRALPTGDQQLQGALRVGGAITGDQLSFVVAIERAFDLQQFFQGHAQLVIEFQVPGHGGASGPVARVGVVFATGLQHVPRTLVIEQFQVGVGIVDPLDGGELETLVKALVHRNTLRVFAGVFQVLQQPHPRQAMHRIGAQVVAQPALGLFGRTAGFVTVDQRIELDVGQRAMLADFREQRDGTVEVELHARQTPGMFTHLRRLMQAQQAYPVIQRRCALAAPFGKVGHLLQQWLLFGESIDQLFADAPGTVQIVHAQSQAEILAQCQWVIRLQHPPFLDEPLGQVIALDTDRDIDALLDPGPIGLRVLECVQLIGEHLHGLITVVGRQQAIERQACVVMPLVRLLTVALELQIDLRGACRIAAGHVPLGCGFEGRRALRRIAVGDLFEHRSGKPWRLEIQRQLGQGLQLRQREFSMIDRLQALYQFRRHFWMLAAQRLQCVQLKTVIRLHVGHWLGPTVQVLARLWIIAKTNQQIDQLQTQCVIVRVRRQQQLGVVGRDRIRLTAVGLEHLFTLEGRPQQATHGDTHHRQCPGIEQTAVFTGRRADHYSPAS